MSKTMLTFFYVRLPEEMASDTVWRLRHADVTVQIAGAFFTKDSPPTGFEERPFRQFPDGTYEVRALAPSNTDTVRVMLTSHEGLIIVREEEHPADISAFLTTDS